MMRFHHAFFFAVAATLTVLVLSCSSSNDSSNSSAGSMSATIQGQNWQANIVQATLSNGVLAIAGQSTQGSQVQVQLRALNVTQPGTVTIGGGSPHMATLSDGTAVFSAGAILGSGRITFTKLTSQEAEGSFEFTAYSSDGKLTRTVTNGAFSVRF